MELIKKDTVWKAGSVHRLTTDIQVANGVKLIIKPGATVIGNGHQIQVGGTLIVAGSDVRHVNISDWYINQLPNPPNAVSNIIIHRADISGGGLLNPTGNAVYGSMTLTDSVISGWNNYSYVWYPVGKVDVEHNVFIDSGGFSVGLDSRGAVTISNNAFVDQTTAAITVWADYDSAPLTITGNSFLSIHKIALASEYGVSYSAPGNWFNTTSKQIINEMVYDSRDDLTLGKIKLGTPLGAPSPQTPSVGTGLHDRFDGSQQSDILYGAAGRDVLKGHAGNDALYGGAQNDFLSGGNGNDWLYGGSGKDHMNGGAGEDVFVFRDLNESAADLKHADIITDFSAGDKIDLSFIDANSQLKSKQHFTFIGHEHFHGSPGELNYKFVDANTIIYADKNGDKTADFCILLAGQHVLHSYDFIL